MINQQAADKASDDAANLLLRIGVAVAFVATPVFQLLSQRAIFILPPIGGAVILAAGMVLAPRLSLRDIFGFLRSRLGLAACFLAIWLALSLLWTPFPAEAAQRLVKAMLTLLCVLPVAASLPARTRAANLYFLPLGVALTSVGALVLSAEAFSDDSDLGAQENLRIAITTALLLLWPALAATHLRNRATLSASLAIIVLAAAVSAPAPRALAATAFAALAFGFALRCPVVTGRWLGRVGATLFLLAPLVPLLAGPLIHGDAPASLLGVKAWSGVIAADGVRILTGHGFNFVEAGYWRGYMPPETPHSMLFQAWTDLGLIGVLAIAALVALACKAAAAQSERLAPFWLGALTYVYAIGAFGVATLQAWWITSLALALGAFALVSRGDYKTARPTAPKWVG
ncbi:hypothetical protein [Rhodoblastus sp.]|uniref:hypothetical protein n=1 Tax=Rhodoblastus sp. TaxID=1962975 RepID=UPI0035B3E071